MAGCNEFRFTKLAMRDLEGALICSLCKKQLCEPVLVGRCEHVFCKGCVTGYCGNECPECHVPVAAKDSHTDLQLKMLLGLYEHLKSVLYEGESSDERVTGNISVTECMKEKDPFASPKGGECASLAAVTCDNEQIPKDTGSRVSLTEQSTTPVTSKEVVTPKSRKICVASTSSSSLRNLSLYSPPPSSDKKFKLRSSDSKLREKRNAKGETLLHVAAIKGDLPKVKEILKKGENPNVKDNAGWTPLHEASNHGFIEIVKCLLDSGANVNVPGHDNITPLHDAIMNNKIEVAQYLVSRGGDLHARTAQGCTVLDMCTKEEIKESLMNTALLYIAEPDTSPSVQKPAATRYSKNKTVFLPTGLDDEQRKKLVQCAQLFGAQIVEQFNKEVSHVIAACDDMGQCNRTLKVLQGILCGKWIMNFHWIELCLEYKQKIIEEIYEVPGTKQQKDTYGPRKGRENALNQFPPLFDGCYFYLYGQFTAPSPTREEICALILQGGGKILLREPRPDTTNTKLTVPYHASSCSKLGDASNFILFQSQPPHDVYLSTGPVRTVSIFWLIDSISTFQLLDPDKVDVPKMT